MDAARPIIMLRKLKQYSFSAPCRGSFGCQLAMNHLLFSQTSVNPIEAATAASDFVWKNNTKTNQQSLLKVIGLMLMMAVSWKGSTGWGLVIYDHIGSVDPFSTN